MLNFTSNINYYFTRVTIQIYKAVFPKLQYLLSTLNRALTICLCYCYCGKIPCSYHSSHQNEKNLIQKFQLYTWF